MKKYLPYYGTLIMIILFIASIVLINSGIKSLVMFVLIPICVITLYVIMKRFSALCADIGLSVVFIILVQYTFHIWLYTIIVFIGLVLVILVEHVWWKSKK